LLIWRLAQNPRKRENVKAQSPRRLTFGNCRATSALIHVG
jgi:hypothetical protein